MDKQLRIALAGNPNSGKTTLFNKLTGYPAGMQRLHCCHHEGCGMGCNGSSGGTAFFC